MKLKWIAAPALILALSMASLATAKDAMPARCIHAIAAATAAFGNMVADQTTELDGTKQLALADTALSLVEQLKCPKNKTLASIDCIVKFVHATAKPPEATDVVGCVKQATGQVLFPKP